MPTLWNNLPNDAPASAASSLRKALEGSKSSMRRTIIVLLVFSILPCTAALAAIVGGIWYLLNRKRLAALPAQQLAPCIALLIAIGQTVILGTVAALHALFAG